MPSPVFFSPAQAMIAAMVTPALLIMASGSLIASALVRLARVVDRVRNIKPDSSPSELDRSRNRAELALRSLEFFFSAVLLFVLTGFGIAADHFSGGRLLWLPISLTMLGMILLVLGAGAMLAESRLAAEQVRDEINLAYTKLGRTA